MKVLTSASVFALCLAASPAFAANDKIMFERCDGLVQPGSREDGMRGAASSSGYFPDPTGTPKSIVESCTQALASPRLLTTQTLRRANLLRARAAANLQLGEVKAALADLDAVDVATADRKTDRFFARSMGVSLTMLRAIAAAYTGDTARAATLAQAAMTARPFALDVQQVGATIVQAGRPFNSPSPSPYERMQQIEPEATTMMLLREAEIGNFERVRKLYPTIKPSLSQAQPTTIAFAVQTAEANRLLTTLIVRFHAAYAYAVGGDAATARQLIAEARVAAKLPDAPAPANGGASAMLFKTQLTQQTGLLDAFVTARAKLVEARIALAEGHPQAAIAGLVGTRLGEDAATLELLTAIKAALPAGSQMTLPEFNRAALSEAQKRELLRQVPRTLLAAETSRAVIDYEKARPNVLGALVGGALTMGFGLLGGIERTDGFRSKVDPATGATDVEFVGNTPSAPVVQEMTLLRAAELARAAGKPGLIVLDRTDYTRTMQTSRGGMVISSTPMGYKTILKVRYVDPKALPAELNGAGDRVIDATQVIDTLGPLYYTTKPGA